MKTRTLYSAVLITSLLFLTGCGSEFYFKKADREFENLRYNQAIDKYEKGLAKEENTTARYRLALSYYFQNDLEAAKPHFIAAKQAGNSDPMIDFYLGKIYVAQGATEKALEHFERYLEQRPDDAVGHMMAASIRSLNERFRDTTLYELDHIPTDDFTNAFSPVPYEEGVVFAGEKKVIRNAKKNPWTGNSYLDLYYMEKNENGEWLPPVVLEGKINGRFHEGPVTFSDDGNTVYFTRSNYYKRKPETNDELENNLKIFSAKKIDDDWKNLYELPFNSDDYSCGHPTLAKDGKTLYFVSDMPGGQGGTDIYVSTLSEGEWSKPKNLGPVVNTSGNEMFPYYHEDGSLYFSSDAHNSMGGLDVFITTKIDGQWASPENLNYPLNSSKDDFGYVLNEGDSTGFLTSRRRDKDEIFKFKKNAPRFHLYGTAHYKGEDTPVEGVKVEITRESDNKLITMVSGPEGKFDVRLDHEEEYFLSCTMEGCFSRTGTISTKDKKYSEDFFADFEVERIEIGKPIVLENIYYDFDKWNIRPDAAKELDKLVALLEDNPEIHIEMGSHTDARGSDNYNEVLSSRRAMAAVKYLIYRGIDADRLTWKGYGESVLVNDCTNGVKCSDEKHEENRRTEFKVTKIESIQSE